MNTKIDVIMAVNSIDNFLSESINSILKQTYGNFMFVIVCNGEKASDVKMHIEENFNDDRIVLFCINLSGLSNALNYGICNSSSKYIARQDADDVSHKDRLSKQIAYLESNQNIGVLGCGVQLIDGHSKPLPDKFISVNRDLSIRRLLPVINSMCHPALIFRRQCIVEAGGYKFGGFSEDHELYLRILRMKKWKFHNLSETLFDYRRHDGQLTSQSSYKNFCDISSFMMGHILLTGNLFSILGILWVFPPVIFFKRLVRKLIRSSV